MNYRGYTITVTTPLNNDGPGYSDPIFTIIRGGRFGCVAHQETIYRSFSSAVKARAAGTAAARQWVDDNLRIHDPELAEEN